ncbi:glycosyltransferase [Bosea thiooxidans]
MQDHQTAVLSFSRIPRDRRVLRQCDLLAQMGSPPLVIGYAAAGEDIGHEFRRWPVPQPTASHRLSTVLRQVPANLGLWAAELGFWAEPRHRWALQELRQSRVRLVIANDWPALIVARRWKAETGGAVHYDTHEFATLEFDESLAWRVIYKRFVTLLEASAIGSADAVSTVGPRLADALQARYRLATRPLVIRNIPNRIELPAPAPPHWPLRLLYHGQVLPDRGLEALLDSIPLWQTPHTLTIRGDGDKRYLSELKRRASTVPAGRVVFEPAVAPDDVMPLAAASADLGVHFTPLETKQRHFSLPNKLFEYIGSGLAVAVSPGADLRQIVQRYGLGVVSQDAGATAIAAAINSLDAVQVAHYRKQARLAAAELCWEREQYILRESLERRLGSAGRNSRPEGAQNALAAGLR